MEMKNIKGKKSIIALFSLPFSADEGWKRGTKGGRNTQNGNGKSFHS